ncbi:hypothetical protein Aglo01_36410 [Actinokineospora globicatena]|nr:hypothetical protein Aglo01_36410 [Actinokineospora globicatena]GLW86431.1 hypothetical protein Aglo02_40700 [Actinokineospora globicatena]
MGSGGADVDQLVDCVEDQPITASTVISSQPPLTSTVDTVDLELAWELARRVEASDVSNETVTRIEQSFDYLAIAYSTTPPAALLPQLRTYLGYVNSLLDKRSTIAEKQRLVVAGGWLSLLAATCHIDLQHQRSATEYLRTAASLARHAGHAEIRAWCYETQAWRVLTDGDYPRAIELCRAAQHHAPTGSSAAIQATAQEGRAHARPTRPRPAWCPPSPRPRSRTSRGPPAWLSPPGRPTRPAAVRGPATGR